MSRLDPAARRRVAVLLALVLLAPPLQVTLVARLNVGGAAPDLILCLAILWAVTMHFTEAVSFALATGVAIDVLTGNPLGASALALVFVVALAGTLRSSGVNTNLLLICAVVVMATLCYYSAIVLVIDSLHARVAWLDAVKAVVVPASFCNLVTAMLLLPLMRKCKLWIDSASKRMLTISSRSILVARQQDSESGRLRW